MRKSNTHALVGAGGGSSRPRQPVEGANTLQTNATIRVVDLIGEGELRGLVNGLQSVFIDGVPAANTPEGTSADSSRNIQGVDFEWRAGLPEQSPLAGIPEIESETIVNREIKHGAPLAQRITNSTTDSVRVTLRFPRLVSVKSNGDTTTASVQFAIAVQPAGGSYTTLLTQTINDKNASPAELSWRIPLTGDGPWNIRVTRVTKDSNSDKLHNTLWWARYTELTELKQSYPYSALMGITAEADKFTGQINRREYEVYGLIVQVPTNYDPETRAYIGIWDGTFKRAWTDNPAWCLYHVLTNRRFGLGGEIADEYLTATKWELYEIARFCDEPVSDGQGGTEPRFRFTGVINKATDARKLLDHMLSNFRGGMYYGGGAVVPVQDAPSDAVALLGNANVIGGEFAYSDLPHSERVSAVAMSFNDPEDGYKLGIELVVNDELVAQYGYKQDDRVAMFCTRRSQAQRLARHILLAQEHESDQLTYSTGLEQAGVRPGDVIKQSDAALAGARVAFRVARSSGIQPNQLLADSLTGVDPALDWTANLMLPDGSIEQRAVTAIDDNTLTLASPPSTPPLPNAMAVMESPQLSPRLWRILSVTERDDLEYTFTAHAYYPNKYASVERGVEVNAYNYSLIRSGQLAVPEAVDIDEYLYLDGGTVKSALTVSITVPDAPDPRVLYVEYQLLAPGASSYEGIDLTRQQTVEVRNARLGVYTARARYVGEPLQITSGWVYSAAFNALGKTAKPSTPTNLQITLLRDTGLSVTIDPIFDMDRDEYSYWISGEANVFTNARRLARIKSTELVISTVPAGTVRVWVQAHDTSDAINYGSIPASATRVIRAPEQPRVTLEYEGTDIVLTWDEAQTDFRVAHYVIHHDRAASDDDILLANVTATTWRQRVTWQGERRFTVATVDIAGNVSTAAEVVISPDLPDTPQVRTRTIDNTVLFNYSTTPGSLPVDRFEVRRGDEFNSASEVAVKAGSSTFTVFEELIGGTYTYWWTAIDSAGNRSPAQAVGAVVTQPPDYQLFASYSAREISWPGVLSNARISPRGGLVMLVNTTETWQQHFQNHARQRPRDQINAGFEYYAQPSQPTSSYTLNIDYGAVIDQAQIAATATPVALDGSGAVTLKIEYRKTTQGAWVIGSASGFFATDFRYIRATVSITASDGDDLFYLDDLVITLDKKVHRDSGTATANATDVGGTPVTFNLNFIDAEQPLITPAGTAARIGVADLTDTPNPTGFSVYLFDTEGNRVSGKFGWQTSGYIINTS